jgi:hypothetical protein
MADTTKKIRLYTPPSAEAVSAAAEETLRSRGLDPTPADARQVPESWRGLVAAMQQEGAPEAIIAGGALRDLFNERPIKDVDIFLRGQGNQGRNKSLMEKAFAKAGLKIEKQRVDDGGYFTTSTEFPDPKHTKAETGSGGFTRQRYAESWTVLAAPDRGAATTRYNVVFVDDTLDTNRAAGKPPEGQNAAFRQTLLESFDIGLCRIACDGREVVSTPEYREDVVFKRISLLIPNTGSLDHLQRIVKKYPDWQLNPAAKTTLQPAPQPSPPGNFDFS